VGSPLQSIPDAGSSATALWASAPFDAALAGEVQHLVGRLDVGQKLWLSGYLAGSLASAAPVAKPAVAGAARPLITIAYGSHSGNGEQLAQRIGQAANARGLSFVVMDMLDCRKNHLQEAKYLLVVVSTHGEGEPPDHAKPLYELMHSRKAPKLDQLQYSVLALGDSSYAMFCETGRRFDAQFEALGARRLHDRVECDVDFQTAADQWVEAVVEAIARENPENAGVTSPSLALARPSATIATAHTRKNPFHAPLLVNQRLTGRNSTKDVRHIELSIEGSGMHYEPGDALGVVPRNQDAEVAAVLESLPFAPELPVEVGAQSATLRDALTHQLDIGLLSRPVVERYAEATGNDALRQLTLAGREADLQRYLHGRHLIDLLREHAPAGLEASDLVKLLRPLAPRLYSIASSLRASPDEVHLTVSHVTYESLGRERAGVVSGALAQLDGDVTAPVYVQRNPAFHLPSSSDAPLIMIGPGTGVAPFRAFLAEREATGARGRNWLFFGDRSFWSDFLYQSEWLEWRKRGLLERIDVAFSRDGAEKIYVQHRIQQRGRELYAWLESGAHIYVCGDAQSMAPDVERALLAVVREHGARSTEQAEEYLLQLQRERRYQKDVY